jgi:hypothetical protein
VRGALVYLFLASLAFLALGWAGAFDERSRPHPTPVQQARDILIFCGETPSFCDVDLTPDELNQP